MPLLSVLCSRAQAMSQLVACHSNPSNTRATAQRFSQQPLPRAIVVSWSATAPTEMLLISQTRVWGPQARGQVYSIMIHPSRNLSPSAPISPRAAEWRLEAVERRRGGPGGRLWMPNLPRDGRTPPARPDAREIRSRAHRAGKSVLQQLQRQHTRCVSNI